MTTLAPMRAADCNGPRVALLHEPASPNDHVLRRDAGAVWLAAVLFALAAGVGSACAADAPAAKAVAATSGTAAAGAAPAAAATGGPTSGTAASPVSAQGNASNGGSSSAGGAPGNPAASAAPAVAPAANGSTAAPAAPPPPAPTAKNPPSNAAAAANAGNPGTAPAAPSTTPFSPRSQVRFGSAGSMFRNLIPSSMLDAQAAEEFDQIVSGAAHANRLYPASDNRVKRVLTAVDRLAPYAPKWNDQVKGWKWQVAVVKSPDIRMYCLPGGKVVVYSGMLDRAKLNDDELGVLLGHEIAHALREHVRERLGEQQAAQMGAGPIPQLFGLADLGAAPLGIGEQLVELKYGRADETEADVIGADISSRAGYDPRAAISLWDKLATLTRTNKDQGFIYVHPYSTARRQDLLKRLPDNLALYAKATGKTLSTLPAYPPATRTHASQASVAARPANH